MPTRCVVPVSIVCALTAFAGADDVLLIPDSDADRIMAFDPADGSVIDLDFITDPGSSGGVDVFNRPLNAIQWDNTILVSDQFADVVSQFNLDGSLIGIFSLAGVRDTQILDNIRGISLAPDSGGVLVANAGNTNPLTLSQSNVVRLAPATGINAEDFAFNRYGGIDGPFDVLVLDDHVLVSDEGKNAIVRYTLDGTFDEFFASDGLDFPQQLNLSNSGTLLVAEFSNGFIREYDLDGALIGQYDPAGLELYRGVIELDNGNLLVTTTAGVHVVTRAGLVLDTPFAGNGARYIERITLPAGLSADTLRERARAHSIAQIKPNRDDVFGTPSVADELGFVAPMPEGPTLGLADARPAERNNAPHTPTFRGPSITPELLIIEDSGFFMAPGITQGTIASVNPSDPADVTVLGNIGRFSWGGLDTLGNAAALVAFENTSNSLRNVSLDPAQQTLIDSVGFHETGVSGLAITNDGTLAYTTTNVGGFAKIVEADATTGEFLRLRQFINRTFSSLAISPDGELFAIENTAGAPRLVTLDYENQTVLSERTITGLGFNQQFETGLDFAAGGTLYATIQGFLQTGPTTFVEISSRLFTLDPATGAATLVGIIDADGTWDASTIVSVPQTGGPCNDADFAMPFGTLDFFDVQAFLNAFGAGSSAADLNNDGLLDFFDVQAFLNAFGAGCP